MSRRRFLHGTAALGAVTLLAAACGPQDSKDTTMDAAQILAEAGLETPDLEMQVSEGPLAGTEKWSYIVTFSGPATEIEAWVDASFRSGIESRAYKDDMFIAVEQLGEGVQKKGDRIASGVNGAVALVVVVGQGDEPTVHVAARRMGR